VAATLKDVAQLAGVSVKTVSNVVNGHPHVSGDLRRRIEEAVQRLGYRPNAAARALRTGRSGLLALAAPGPGSPLAPRLIEAIVHHAARHGFRVVIDAPGGPVRQAGHLRSDAALLTAGATAAGLAGAYLATGIPVVVLGESPDPRAGSVIFDAARAARDARDHLLRTGRRRIASIGAEPQPAARRGRTDGYLAARGFLSHDERPDGLVCFSDQLALGAVRAAADAGLRIPHDVAVTGMGDSEEGRWSRPALTTVATDPAFVAQAALELITARLAGAGEEGARVVVPHTLVRRESTGSGVSAQ